MTSSKLLYLVPASDRPDQARKKPMAPRPRTMIARRNESGSVKPSALKDSAPKRWFNAQDAGECNGGAGSGGRGLGKRNHVLVRPRYEYNND